MSISEKLWIAAGISLAASLLLGYAVSRSSSLWRIDVEAAALRGIGVQPALIFTLSGRWLPLLVVAGTALAMTVAARTGYTIALAIVATQLASQAAAEFVKRIFRRSRPDAWIVHEELGFSFPSGHATTAVVFYGSWAAFVLLLPTNGEVKAALALVIAMWAAGILWSRMALGAHYLVDIIGGSLFGAAWACALWAVLLQVHAFPLA